MQKQHVLIIGGSSGIGFAAARQMINLGYKVTIAARTAAKLEAAKCALDNDADTIVLNAADADAIREAYSALGAFDHLVLALGSSKGAGAFATVSLEGVRQGFEEKVFPHFLCAQAALPFLSLRGSITFISAVTAHAAMPGTAGIGAANAAIAALVPILAAELRPLRVNGVSPGVIDTPWWDFLSTEQKIQVFADFTAKTPVERIGQPDDVAQAIAFLISNTYMNGHIIICDGGIRLTT